MIRPTHPLYRQHPAVAWRSIDGEAVLIDPRTGTVFVLNPVGARIWEWLAEGRPEDELAARVGAEHGRPAPEVADDVTRFLAALSERSLIEVER